jgi:hypothetical protein
MDDENKKLITDKNVGAQPPADDGKKAAWLKRDFNIENRLNGALALDNLVQKQKELTEQSLSRNNATLRDNQEASKVKAGEMLGARISQLEADIAELKEKLGMARSAEQAQAQLLALPVVNEQGIVVSDSEARADPSKSSSSFIAVRRNRRPDY